MKKIKVSDATNIQLDWLVAHLQGLEFSESGPIWFDGEDAFLPPVAYSPTTRGDHMVPIIEREGILTRPIRRPDHVLDGMSLAMYDGSNTGSMVQWVKRKDWPRHYSEGATTLIAAARCYITSKLGEEVDVPEGLT
jgi:hypothetical protein